MFLQSKLRFIIIVPIIKVSTWLNFFIRNKALDGSSSYYYYLNFLFMYSLLYINLCDDKIKLHYYYYTNYKHPSETISRRGFKLFENCFFAL